MPRLPRLQVSPPPNRDGRRPGAPPPGGGPNAQPPKRGLSIPLWVYVVGILAVLAFEFYSFGVSRGPSRATLTYNQFLSEVSSGNVTKIDITGQSVTGTLRHGIAQPTAVPTANASASSVATAAATTGANASATPAPAAATNASSAIKAGSFTEFQSTLPPFDDPTLLPLLKQQNVTVQIHEASSGSFLSALLINGLPLLLFAVLIYFMFRQGRGAQSQIFGFGRSRARQYNEQKPSITFADVAGEDDAKLELTEVVDFLKEPLKYTAIGAKLPRGVLLVGPPGTGKTLLSRAVAGEAGVPFFSISGSEFVEMFVGVGASRVRDLFETAKKSSPCIIFIDEIDAVGRQRGAGMGGGNDEREQTLNQILVEMDGFDTNTSVIVMAATNRPDVLDPALLRPGRFDRQVTVGLPDRRGREAILTVHTRGKPLTPEVNLNVLARSTPGFSGADLANLANEAALNAARFNRRQITMPDFEAALDKIVLGTKQAILMDPDERRSVAYHEGGHALVACFTPGADPLRRVTIVPHGRALGVTLQAPIDDRHNYSKDYLLGRLGVMLGGRAAEEVVLKEMTTGAESDLKAASDLARRMVGTWGMSDELGPVYFGVGEEHPFLGRVMAQDRAYGDETASAIDAAVQRLVEAARERAVSIVKERRAELDGIAEALQQQETLTSEEVDEILKKTTPIATPAVSRDA